jgi:hypothetical protein
MAEAPPRDMPYFVAELKEDMVTPAAREIYENYSKIQPADVISHIQEFVWASFSNPESQRTPADTFLSAKQSLQSRTCPPLRLRNLPSMVRVQEASKM